MILVISVLFYLGLDKDLGNVHLWPRKLPALELTHVHGGGKLTIMFMLYLLKLVYQFIPFTQCLQSTLFPLGS